MKIRRLTSCLMACVMLLVHFAGCKKTANSQPEDPSLPPAEEEPLPESPTLPPVEEEPLPETPPSPPVETPPVVEKALYVECTANSVNVRAGAGRGYASLGQVEKGTMYAVSEEKDGWYQITYKNKTGYISSAYTKTFALEKSENPVVEAVLAKGYLTLGVPYVYGAVRLHDGKGNFLAGFTALKFDCSSLTQYAFYYGAGVLLNTTTRTQIRQGKYVPPSDLSRGDCIYYTNETRYYLTGIERIGHVAIYLGKGYILHTASDYARIEKMSDLRWSYYIEARRFV